MRGDDGEGLRVGLVTAHYPPGRTGGVETVVRAQARELARLGVRVRVVAGSDWPHAGHDVHRGELDGVPVAWLPRTSAEEPCATSGLAPARPRLAELVAAELAGCDVVHVHHWETLPGNLVRTLAATAPVAVTLHDDHVACARTHRAPRHGAICPDDDSVGACALCLAPSPGVPAEAHTETGSTALDGLAALLVARRAAFAAELAAASLVLVPSATHLAHLFAALPLPLERTSVLHHGLCVELGAPQRARAYWDGARPLSVLHFGNRSELKGTLDLARALAPLPAGAVELVLAGGEAEAGLDERVRAALGAVPVRFLGPYEPRQLAGVAGLCDLAVFPSRAEESYGLVVEEALAMGLPVWVSDRGAPVEVIDLRARGRKSPGRVLPAGDPAAWTTAFRDLLAEPDRLQRYRRALPRTVPTAADAARELLEHYAELARAARAARAATAA